MDASPTRCQQLISAYENNPKASIMASIRLSKDEDYKRYGYAAGTEKSAGVLEVNQVIEKPGVGMINSDYAIIGGGIYQPEMFSAIEEAMKRLAQDNTPRELVYLDAVRILLENKQQILAVEIKNGEFHDCGNKLEYLKTVVKFGLKHEDLKEDFSNYLKNLKV